MSLKLAITRTINFIGLVVLLSVGTHATDALNNGGLSFTVSTDKKEYILGEPVKCTFDYKNLGKDPVRIFGGGVDTGAFDVMIAGPDNEFKEFYVGIWGLKVGRSLDVAPNQTVSYSAIVLWHGAKDVSHLSDYAAKLALEGIVATAYAFPAPGIYKIKGVSSTVREGTPIETEPIEIVVSGPVGEDLQVWNRIKDDRQIALLLQGGGFDVYKDSEAKPSIDKIEQIIEQFPDSTYTQYLRSNLEKYKEGVKARKAAYGF